MKSLLLLLLILAWPILADAASTPLDDARVAFQKGDFATAESLLIPLTTGDRADAAACHQLGLVRQRQGRPDEAAVLFERATTLDPKRPEYFSALGSAIGERMRTATLIQKAALAGKLKRAFAKSVELDPNHLAGLIGLARFYSNAPEIAGGSIEKAREFAARVQKLNPFLGEIELASVAEQAEEFAEALEHYDAASRLQPTSAGPHTGAGRMLAKLDRKDEARARLTRALEIDPKREIAKKALAELDASGK